MWKRRILWGISNTLKWGFTVPLRYFPIWTGTPEKIVEYTAGMFDEFLLDDFFFTACRCKDCIREKGDRTWVEFRAAAFPDLQFGTNSSWSFINAGSGDYHSFLLLLDTYGKGKLFTLAVPDMLAGFSALPIPVMDLVSRAFAVKDIYISGRNVSLFLYDNNIFVLYCYADKDSLPETVTIHLLRGIVPNRISPTNRKLVIILLLPENCRHSVKRLVL